MKVLSKVKEIPSREYNAQNSKYKPIYNKVSELKKGEFLPVEFETTKKAVSFAAGARNQKYVGVTQRKNRIYLWNKEAK